MPTLMAAKGVLIGDLAESLRKPPFFAEFPHGEFERDVGAGDGGGAGASVGGEDVAIDAERARAEGLQVDGGADAASDQPLDFGAASVDAALGDVARFAVERRVGQHRVLGGDPAAGDLLFLHPARDVFLDRDGADDLRCVRNWRGPIRRRGARCRLEGDGAKLVGTAAVVTAFHPVASPWTSLNFTLPLNFPATLPQRSFTT
jgi:hypothetical protein